jgi:hypothetical protein
MVVSPYQVQAAGGQTVAFSADGWDQLGNQIAVTPTWSVDGGGSIDANGVFTATTEGGPFAVKATSVSLSATGFVWVTSTAAVIVPPTIQSIVCSNGIVTLTWAAMAGTTYRLQYKGDVTDNTWLALVPDVVANGPTASMTDMAGGVARIYRVMLVK